MSAHALRLLEDTLAPCAGYVLGPTNRVLAVLAGQLCIVAGGRTVSVSADGVWHGAGSVQASAGRTGATVLRWELVSPARPAHGAARLEHPLELDPAAAYLMRADRVEFEPGGVALPHGHRGGGIRRLLAGALEVTVGDGAPRLMRPGDAWFESGREPVLAKASPTEATAFLRVSILPPDVRGQSSIVYVDPADAARGKPRRYTLYVDDPIELS
jgi:quercetin dioxygenase-like cupin family protein